MRRRDSQSVLAPVPHEKESRARFVLVLLSRSRLRPVPIALRRTAGQRRRSLVRRVVAILAGPCTGPALRYTWRGTCPGVLPAHVCGLFLPEVRLVSTEVCSFSTTLTSASIPANSAASSKSSTPAYHSCALPGSFPCRWSLDPSSDGLARALTLSTPPLLYSPCQKSVPPLDGGAS